MRALSQLQIGLIIAGVLLVVGVILYNSWQMRRLRRRLASGDRAGRPARGRGAGVASGRTEPTLRSAPGEEGQEAEEFAPSPAAGGASTPVQPGVEVEHDPDWRAPMAPLPALPEDDATAEPGAQPAAPSRSARPVAGFEYSGAAAAPDPDIECIVMLQPVKAAGAGALAAGLHARLGKPVRWFGRREREGVWQRVASDTRGDYAEFAACMLLADRNGPASKNQLDAFVRLARDIAPTLPGAFVAPDTAPESERAQALDRLCAELDMQIGLTIQKAAPATVTGTRLRGVAEAAGFRLAPSGRFEWVQEETGAVLFAMQNVNEEPFTIDALRQGAVAGVVFVLDVPRVTDPPRAFDQMKLAAKRMALTLDGEVVDDNRRPLNDAGLAAIRAQVVDATAALKHYHIEPGSPRALKLFAA